MEILFGAERGEIKKIINRPAESFISFIYFKVVGRNCSKFSLITNLYLN